jgi:hypothetical protein
MREAQEAMYMLSKHLREMVASNVIGQTSKESASDARAEASALSLVWSVSLLLPSLSGR